MVKITDYTQMTLKQLEKEYTKESQKLLDMVIDGRYDKPMVDYQKSLVDYIYKKISIKHQIINNTIGK